MAKLIEAWNSETGAKLPQRVPDTWPRIFKTVSATDPRKKAPAGASDDVPEADSPEDVSPSPKTARRGRQSTAKES